MGLIQVFVVMNTKKESFEVTKWYDAQEFSGNKKKMINNLTMISKKLYSVITKKDIDSYKHMIGVGTEEDPEISDNNEITNKIFYAWYFGKCMDEKHLTYFFNKQTLAKGEISLEEIRSKM